MVDRSHQRAQGFPTMPKPCPICERPAAPRNENRFFPLCSERCRLLDLGNWLGEGYSIPGGPTNDFAATGFDPDEEGDF